MNNVGDFHYNPSSRTQLIRKHLLTRIVLNKKEVLLKGVSNVYSGEYITPNVPDISLLNVPLFTGCN